MLIDDLLIRLHAVKRRGTRWSAKCPAHADKSPSLQITEGEKGLLLKCWAGCSLDEICAALHVPKQDLFYDRLDTDPRKRQATAVERERQRQARVATTHKQGRRIDARREAEAFVRSRQGIDIRSWSHDQLDHELRLLADAYLLLAEESRSWER